ncbi:uncharacterized protein TM35_001071050 [Trypanosoma theileri]|uniref:Uncharacterized protein n=1 Tax=Trypanosoma theileri TaxID=67003 RepID=A0A1X0NEN8_9TRYP|nr:uncharacterized protein TM35_001071050 [Trypanosoma theileri]ORC81754.1 hypothetical protein TM35_001071050 [Trypanosoma theileri]
MWRGGSTAVLDVSYSALTILCYSFPFIIVLVVGNVVACVIAHWLVQWNTLSLSLSFPFSLLSFFLCKVPLVYAVTDDTQSLYPNKTPDPIDVALCAFLTQPPPTACARAVGLMRPRHVFIVRIHSLLDSGSLLLSYVSLSFSFSIGGVVVTHFLLIFPSMLDNPAFDFLLPIFLFLLFCIQTHKYTNPSRLHVKECGVSSCLLRCSFCTAPLSLLL